MLSYIPLIWEESFLDYPESKGPALVLYLSGCEHKCIGCQNLNLQKQLIDNISAEQIEQYLIEVKKLIKKGEYKYIVLSGGDPLYKNNLNCTKALLKMIIKNNLEFIVYTGYEYNKVSILIPEFFDFGYFKCGKYIKGANTKKFKNIDYELASENQKLFRYGKEVN